MKLARSSIGITPTNVQKYVTNPLLCLVGFNLLFLIVFSLSITSASNSKALQINPYILSVAVFNQLVLCFALVMVNFYEKALITTSAITFTVLLTAIFLLANVGFMISLFIQLS